MIEFDFCILVSFSDLNNELFPFRYRYSGVWLITRCGALLKSGYNLNDWSLCIIVLVFTGFVSRVIAFLCMVTFQKK